MAYKVLDLFSGAGGLSRGFYDAGYDVVLGVDFDEAALKTFKENHGKAEAMKLDLFDHSNIDVIINFLEEKDIKLDVLCCEAVLRDCVVLFFSDDVFPVEAIVVTPFL